MANYVIGHFVAPCWAVKEPFYVHYLDRPESGQKMASEWFLKRPLRRQKTDRIINSLPGAILRIIANGISLLDHLQCLQYNKDGHRENILPCAILIFGRTFYPIVLFTWKQSRSMGSALIAKGGIVMAKKIAIINLKGGVGKTATAVGVSTALSGAYRKRVLIIDLDPQTNATIMLIGEENWKDLNKRGMTLDTVFRRALTGSSPINIRAIIQRGVGNIDEVTRLDLLPSSLDMVDLQDRIATAHGPLYNNNPTDILKNAIGSIEADYDYIIIDCPPNLGLITLNGLRIADGYVIPAIPDFMSTYGIPQIVKRVKLFSQQISRDIVCYGVIATRVRHCRVHDVTLDQLRKGYDAPLFQHYLGESTRISEAAEKSPVKTLRQHWGYSGQYDQLSDLTKELMWRAEN